MLLLAMFPMFVMSTAMLKHNIDGVWVCGNAATESRDAFDQSGGDDPNATCALASSSSRSCARHRIDALVTT